MLYEPDCLCCLGSRKSGRRTDFSPDSLCEKNERSAMLDTRLCLTMLGVMTKEISLSLSALRSRPSFQSVSTLQPELLSADLS
jgi:hypothetical protein